MDCGGWSGIKIEKKNLNWTRHLLPYCRTFLLRQFFAFFTKKKKKEKKKSDAKYRPLKIAK